MIPAYITVTLMLPGYLMELSEGQEPKLPKMAEEITEAEPGDGYSYLDDHRGGGRVWSIDRKCHVQEGDEQVDEHNRLTERLLVFEHMTELQPHAGPIGGPWLWDSMCEDAIADHIMQGIANDVLPMLQRNLDSATTEWQRSLKDRCKFWRFSFIALFQPEMSGGDYWGPPELDGFTYHGTGRVVTDKKGVES